MIITYSYFFQVCSILEQLNQLQKLYMKVINYSNFYLISRHAFILYYYDVKKQNFGHANWLN